MSWASMCPKRAAILREQVSLGELVSRSMRVSGATCCPKWKVVQVRMCWERSGVHRERVTEQTYVLSMHVSGASGDPDQAPVL